MSPHGSSPTAAPALLLAGLAALLLAPACGGDGDAGVRAGEGGPASSYSPPRDPALAEVRAALEAGRGKLALDLLERTPGFEAACLRARAQLLAGDAVAALAALEQARALDPESPLLLGTEVELLASLRRLDTAAELLARALAASGPEPVLLRARGVYELQLEGRAASALEALERARARDPGMPFLRWPLAQAHLLVGRALLEKSPGEATVHAMAALALEPELDDALELQGEALTNELRYEEALECYRRLEQRGRDVGEIPALLHQRCATRMLLELDRPGAVEHYLAARRLGMDDEGLGFGADVLEKERREALDRGIVLAEAGDWPGAERAFERALEIAPEDLEAENHRGVARFEREDFAGAAACWERVLAAAARRGLLDGPDALPDPVPLNLAKAWRMAGEPERARAVLSGWIDERPEHPWTDPARELLFALEAEALGD